MILEHHYAVRQVLDEGRCADIIEEGLSNLQPAAVGGGNLNRRNSEVAWLPNSELFTHISPYIAECNRTTGWQFDIDHSEGIQFTKYGVGQYYDWHPDGGSDWHSIYQPAMRDKYGVWKRCRVTFNDGGYQNIIITDEDAPVREIYETKQLQMPFTGEKDWWGKVRKLSLTINLSNPRSYEGGDFEIQRDDDIEVVTEGRGQGNMILFPSFLPHRVTPVTRGTRYSLVIWLLGRPFR